MNELVGKIEAPHEYKVDIRSDEVTIDVKINEVGPRGFPGKDGQDGERGPEGKAATIRVGSVKTGDPDTQASVENSGTENAAIFDFVIPQGIQGVQGPEGKQGIQGPEGKQGIQGQRASRVPKVFKVSRVKLVLSVLLALLVLLVHEVNQVILLLKA